MNVLIASKSLGEKGGVVNYVRMLLPEFVNTNASHFSLGKRGGGSVVGVSRIVVRWLALSANPWVNVDIVHLNPSMESKALARDIMLSLIVKTFRPRVKVFLMFHGWNEAFVRKVGGSFIAKAAIMAGIGNADAIGVLAERFRTQLVELGVPKSKIRILSTMFNEEQFRGRVAKGGAFRRRVLYLSRLEREKGIYELLEAFRCLAKEDNRLRLVVAGDGPEFGSVMQWVAESDVEEMIEVKGYVQGEDKLNTLCDSDLFVLPTYYPEGLPVSLLEAMAVGLPVIASAVGGIASVIEDGRNGICLREVNPGTVERALRMAIYDSQSSRRWGEQNRRDAWERYSSGRVGNAVERIYMDVLGLQSPEDATG